MSWVITGTQKVNWDPSLISTALWLDAADATTLFDATTGGSLPAADGNVARWEDKSGNNRHATQDTSGARPARKISLFNGRDSLRFDGSNDLLKCDFGAIIAQPINIFVVTQLNGFPSTFNGRVFSSSSSVSSEADLFLPLAVTQAPGFFVWNFGTNVDSADAFGSAYSIYNALASGASSVIYRNGTVATSGNPGTNGLARYCGIGGRHHDGLRNYNGDISEIIAVTANLTTAERQKIEGYLAHKWGLTANLPAGHPYKVNPPAP